MAEQLDPEDLINLKELLMANSLQMNSLSQLLLEEGFITEQRYCSNTRPV
jgi:hypothetical protein